MYEMVEYRQKVPPCTSRRTRDTRQRQRDVSALTATGKDESHEEQWKVSFRSAEDERREDFDRRTINAVFCCANDKLDPPPR